MCNLVVHDRLESHAKATDEAFWWQAKAIKVVAAPVADKDGLPVNARTTTTARVNAESKDGRGCGREPIRGKRADKDGC